MRFLCPKLLPILALAASAAFPQQPESEEPVAHFGSSVVITNGLKGDIYFLPKDTKKLPKFTGMKSEGSIYTNELNVPTVSFTEGFPGVTDRFEWFAIDYNGKFYVDQPGKYLFAVLSDDGSKLYIDSHEVIDNDGTHPSRTYAAFKNLKRGSHTIRISYFQGPRTQLALILVVRKPGDDDFSLFNMEDFLSPADRAELRKARPDDPYLSEHPPRRKPNQEFQMAPTIGGPR